MSEATTVVWFRRDLRVADHPALAEAAGRGRVVCLFVVDPRLLSRRHHQAPRRLAFLRAGLEALGEQLADRGGQLVVRTGDPVLVVPEIAREAGAERVVATREVSPFGRARDAAVATALASGGVAFDEAGGDLLHPPEELPGPDGNGYRVFTPFYRAWKRQPLPAHIPAPETLRGPRLRSDGLDALPEDPILPAGEQAAHNRLDRFIADHGGDYYDQERDQLALDGTSGLSPYLRFGMCTAAQVGRALGPEFMEPGNDAFWRQIAWREFFHHLLLRRPDAARAAMIPGYRAVRWDTEPGLLETWTAGLTGYPLVDAAMRQLADTGWVHNRARMVAASFLVKDLLVDWRRGETVFMQRLVDGDPANNNGGWQWVASTGTDAAPYFRVMNPIRQARRFDPDGIYVKRHVPELRRVPVEHIHEPWLMDQELQRRVGCRIGVDYPAPVVDHLERQREAIARYREAAGR